MKLPIQTISKKQWIAIAVLILVGAVGAFAILHTERAEPADAHDDVAGHGDGEHRGEQGGDGHDLAKEDGDAEHHAESPTKGPHGGELLADGSFGLEIKLVEEGGKALLRTWLFDHAKPLPPAGSTVMVTLTRPSGEQQQLALRPTPDGFVTSAPVAEPHVFDARIEVQTPKKPHLLAWSMQEGKVAMTDAQVKAAGITVSHAAAVPIRSSLQLPGEIRFNEDRTAHVVPRVAGIVERVDANLGQRVRQGQVLAVLGSASVSEQRSELQAAHKRLQLARTTHEREKTLWQEKISPQQDVLQAGQAVHEAEIAVANAREKLRAIGAGAAGESLNRYELRAPFDATVVEKHIALGESVKEDANVFTLSDLSSVWAEISISARDLNQVRVGEQVTVRSSATHETASGTVAYVGSLLGEQTRTAKARITLANPNGAWRPGLFVTVELVTSEAPAAVTVASEAIQQVDNKPVVYLKVPGGFSPQPVELGRSDGKRVEVLRGLRPNAPHASAGSHVVKSEAGKGSATHTH